MVSFITVRRADWILKISVYKNKQIMVIAQHCYDFEKTVVTFFTDQNDAADFIEKLIIED